MISLCRSHWKKIAFAVGVTYYGVNDIKERNEIRSHMREICSEVQACSTIQRTHKNLLVVLNPTARNKSAEKYFRKYCAPILHLAGYRIDVFKTLHSGHAKQFIENLETLPDAVIIAGGDGTACEVVTGLMRRSDGDCVIAFLPLGTENRSSQSSKEVKEAIRDKLGYVKLLTSSLDPVLSGSISHRNIMEFNALNNLVETNSDTFKPIFGVSEFSWGILKDVDIATKKYWYLGRFSRYMAALQKSISDKKNWIQEAQCLFHPIMPASEQKETFHYGNRVDQSPIMDERFHLSLNQLYITLNGTGISCKLFDQLTPGWDFFKGVSTMDLDTLEPAKISDNKSLILYPLNQSADTFYTIDGDEFEALPIHISVSTKRIKVFK